jgi:hypothetical protein
MDEAVASGTRALAIAERLDDLGLRHLTTSVLVQQYNQRGEYERGIELATANLAASPSETIYEGFRVPISVRDRSLLVLGLTELGDSLRPRSPARRPSRSRSPRKINTLSVSPTWPWACFI